MKKAVNYLKKIVKYYFVQMGKTGLYIYGPYSLYSNNIYNKKKELK